MTSIQIGFYANTSQRPILKEKGLINIRSTIGDTYPLLSVS